MVNLAPQVVLTRWPDRLLVPHAVWRADHVPALALRVQVLQALHVSGEGRGLHAVRAVRARDVVPGDRRH